MRPHPLVLSLMAVTLLRPLPLCAQAKASPTHDPVLTAIRGTEPDYSDPATRRLEVLTEIWGNTGLYHPVPSAAHLLWDEVLVAALRELPATHSERDFAGLINRIVFAPVHDPLLYATTRADNDVAITLPNPGVVRWLGDGAVYVSATDQGYLPDFGPRLRRLIDSAAATGTVRRLVVDLRAANPGRYREGVAGVWLGMWAPATLSRGAGISVLKGTDDALNGVRWIVSPRDSLTALPPTVGLPTVFLVNRTSYAAFEHSLDAIRTSRRDVAILFEPTGPIPNLGYNSFQSWYPDSILLPHSRLPALSADGALGTVVDTVVERSIAFEQMSDATGRALALRAAQRPRAPFAFAGAIRDDSVTPSPLSAEQRLAGLLKTWFWVRHFYAYLDDASSDWGHLLSTWVPRVTAARSDEEYYRVMNEVVALINDTHGDVIHPLSEFPMSVPGRMYSVPLRVGWVEDRLAITRVDSSDASLGLAPGDEIIAVDGQSVRDIDRMELPRFSVSRPQHHAPLLFLLGAKDSKVHLRITTRVGTRDLTMPRSRFFPSLYDGGPIFRHAASEVLPDNIGYLNLAEIRSSVAFDSAMTMLADTRGMIIDDQGPVAGMGSLDLFRFITDPAQFMRRVESISYTDGGLPMHGFASSATWTIPFERKNRYSKPIVMIVGSGNVSRYESLAQWFSLSHRATFVGVPTSGTYGTKDGITLPGGATVHFTAGRALWPDGAKYHGVGVVPDVIAAPTFAGLRAGRDEAYDASIRAMHDLLRRSPKR